MKEDALQKELEEKELSLQDLDALNQVLIIKEHESNDELQEARKELINVIFLMCLFFLSADFVKASVQLYFEFFSYLNSWLSVEYVWPQSCFR